MPSKIHAHENSLESKMSSVIVHMTPSVEISKVLDGSDIQMSGDAINFELKRLEVLSFLASDCKLLFVINVSRSMQIFNSFISSFGKVRIPKYLCNWA